MITTAKLNSKSDNFWKEKLTPDQFNILRQKGTEAAFSGKYDQHFKSGTYQCAGCGQNLFSSNTKYYAHCGWPSFWDVLDKTKVKLKPDNTLGMTRTEVICANCQGHLGHVFPDGPKDKTSQRYCINSAALNF